MITILSKLQIFLKTFTIELNINRLIDKIINQYKTTLKSVILEMQQRLTSDTLKKMMPVFQMQTYKTSDNKMQYISDLIEVILHKKKINNPVLCMNELNDLISQIKIPLKHQQIHEIYLYATYQRFQKKQDTKKKLLAMVNQQRHKVDKLAAAEWIHQKIQCCQIKFSNPTRTKKSYSESSVVKEKKLVQKLPPIRGTYGQKLQQELKYLIEIFEQMQKERQNSGLIPLNQNQEEQIQIPNTNIPYDPELYALNNTLSKLRIKAQDRLARIIQLAKSDKKIRVKLEEAIQKFQKQRIQANQKVGRIGAMKAYKRVMQKKRGDARKIKELNLGEDEDLVRASQMYALLNLPEIKNARIVY